MKFHYIPHVLLNVIIILYCYTYIPLYSNAPQNPKPPSLIWGHHCVSQFWSRDSYPLDGRPLWSWQKHIMVHSSEGWEPMLPFNCPHAVAHASIIERYVFKRIVKNQPKMKLPTDTSCVQYTQRYVDGRCAGSLHTATYLHTNCLSTYVPLTLYHSLFLLFSKKK